jgi:hypothetical protein
MGIILVASLVIILLLILWLPTLIALLNRKSKVTQIIWFLVFEIIIAVGLLAVLDFFGAINPAHYLFLSAILVSAGGFFYACIKRVK